MTVDAVTPFRLKAAAVVLAGFFAGAGLAIALGGTSSHPRDRTTVLARPKTVTSPATAPTGTPPPYLAPTAYASFMSDVVAPLRPSTVEIAIVPTSGGEAVALGGNGAMPAGTSIDVPILVALLKQAGSNDLNPAEQYEARQAIELVDSAAVAKLFAALAARAGSASAASHLVENVLRTAGDSSTTVPTTATDVGNAQWTPQDAALFFGSLDDDCLLDQKQTNNILGLMGSVDTLDREGLGSSGFQPPVPLTDGANLGSGGSGTVSQSGLVTNGSSWFAVSITGYAPAGQDGGGVLSTGASWLHSNLEPVGTSSGSLCSGGSTGS